MRLVVQAERPPGGQVGRCYRRAGQPPRGLRRSGECRPVLSRRLLGGAGRGGPAHPPEAPEAGGAGEQALWFGGTPTSSPGRGVHAGIGPSRGAKPHIAHEARGRGRLRTSTVHPDGAVERPPVCALWTAPSSSRPGPGSPSGPALFAESLLVPSPPAHVLNLDLLSRCAVHIGMPHAGLLFQYGVVCSAVKNELAAHCVGISQ